MYSYWGILFGYWFIFFASIILYCKNGSSKEILHRKFLCILLPFYVKVILIKILNYNGIWLIVYLAKSTNFMFSFIKENRLYSQAHGLSVLILFRHSDTTNSSKNEATKGRKLLCNFCAQIDTFIFVFFLFIDDKQLILSKSRFLNYSDYPFNGIGSINSFFSCNYLKPTQNILSLWHSI